MAFAQQSSQLCLGFTFCWVLLGVFCLLDTLGLQKIEIFLEFEVPDVLLCDPVGLAMIGLSLGLGVFLLGFLDLRARFHPFWKLLSSRIQLHGEDQRKPPKIFPDRIFSVG